MADDDLVKVGEAQTEQEAAIICGFLASNGIKATYDKGNVAQIAEVAFPVGGVANSLGHAYYGRQEIVVLPQDAERAKQLLAEQR